MTPFIASLDMLKTLFFILAVTAQYLFFFLLLPQEYVDVPVRMALFAGVFVVLAGYYLFEAEIRRGLGMAVAAVRARPALVLNPLRITLTLTIVAGALYGLYTLVPWQESAFTRGVRELFFVLYIIDAVIIFLAVVGEPGLKEQLRGQASRTFAGTDQLIRQVPLELFILSTLLSFTLKILLIAFIGVGITGMVQLLLYIVLPWLLVSLFITAVWLGSFGATRRYWEWLITAPPKAVIRNLFDMNTDALTCEHCQHTIPLVSIYECPGCKFKFKGHYFAWCPYCFQRFGYVNCPNLQCGLSRKRPLWY